MGPLPIIELLKNHWTTLHCWTTMTASFWPLNVGTKEPLNEKDENRKDGKQNMISANSFSSKIDLVVLNITKCIFHLLYSVGLTAI